MAENLTLHDQEELAECERVIRNGMEEATAIDQAEILVANHGHVKLAVARALYKIYSNKWYKKSHSSFEKYLIDRFDGRLSRGHAYRWIEWMKTSDKMSPIGDIPNEYMARNLQLVPEPLKEKVLDEAIKRGNTTGKNLSDLTYEIFANLPADEQLEVAKHIEEKNSHRGQSPPKVGKSSAQLKDEAEQCVARLRKTAGRLLKGKALLAVNRKLDSVMEAIRGAK